MLILITFLLVLVPASVILYPFLRKGVADDYVDGDEASTMAGLSRLWDSAISGLKNTEMEHAIGNLAVDDYVLLRKQYMTEAALVMKAMELQGQEEQDLLDYMEGQVREARSRVLSDNPGLDGTDSE